MAAAPVAAAPVAAAPVATAPMAPASTKTAFAVVWFQWLLLPWLLLSWLLHLLLLHPRLSSGCCFRSFFSHGCCARGCCLCECLLSQLNPTAHLLVEGNLCKIGVDSVFFLKKCEFLLAYVRKSLQDFKNESSQLQVSESLFTTGRKLFVR
jgi:hypothetical protein